MKKLSPSSHIIQKINKRKIKIDNSKNSCIYQNKTGILLNEKKSALNNNKNISHYASKPNIYNHADSIIKHRINSKKNNSMYFINYEKSKENIFDSNYINENISHKIKEINTSSINLV